MCACVCVYKDIEMESKIYRNENETVVKCQRLSTRAKKRLSYVKKSNAIWARDLEY